MRQSRSSLALFGLIGAACCSPAAYGSTSSEYAVKDTHYVPLKWKRVGVPLPNHVLSVQIGLKQGRWDELEKHLNEASDPDHPKYGEHLSKEQVADLIKPTKETDSLVRTWLHENGVPPQDVHCNHAGDWLRVTLPVSHVESLLNTTYSTYRHEDDEEELIRAPIWSLPAHLHDHVETVQPTTSFLRPRPQKKLSMFQTDVPETSNILSSDIPFTAEAKQVCDPKLVTPDCLRTYYGTKNYTVKNPYVARMSMTNYLGELSNRSDAYVFANKFRTDAVPGVADFKFLSINGGTTQQTPNNQTQLDSQTGVEGALDVQTLLGIAFPLDLTIYSTGGRNPDFKPDQFTPTNSDEPYLDWVNFMLALPSSQLPTVVSNSYADNEQTVGQSYARAVCKAFAALSARGVTLLFGSGDEGVGGDGTCYSNDGRNASMFTPEFPSSCPYVTTIGGTYKFAPEVAAYDGRFKTPYTSGGGFSNIFPMPEWQWSTVKAYLEANNQFPNYTGLYNPIGRAYPDFSAQSQNFSVVWNNKVVPVDGTSAATPAAAAILALVNDALIAGGKPVLGWMNPWLYKKGFSAFNDILSGSSAGCSTPGFPATKGWDAVTGFGTPYFPDILKALGVADQLPQPAPPAPPAPPALPSPPQPPALPSPPQPPAQPVQPPPQQPQTPDDGDSDNSDDGDDNDDDNDDDDSDDGDYHRNADWLRNHRQRKHRGRPEWKVTVYPESSRGWRQQHNDDDDDDK